MTKTKTLFLALALCVIATTAQAAQCPDKNTREPLDKAWAETFGGGNPRTYDTADLAEKQAEATRKFNEDLANQTDSAAKQSNQTGMEFLDNCIAGINLNIFSGSFAGLWDSIVQAVKKKMCAYTLLKSSEYLAQALNMMQYDLPMGLGTIGPDSRILGSTLTYTTVTTQHGASVGTYVNKNTGLDMFQNGGSLLLNNLR